MISGKVTNIASEDQNIIVFVLFSNDIEKQYVFEAVNATEFIIKVAIISDIKSMTDEQDRKDKLASNALKVAELLKNLEGQEIT